MTRISILVACSLLAAPLTAIAEDTPLTKNMESFSDIYKGFKKEKDPAKGAAMAREAQQLMIKALAETPKMLAGMPEGPAKIKAAVAYRKMIGQVYVNLCEIEEAYINGKLDDVERIRTALGDLKKSGHEQFVEEE